MRERGFVAAKDLIVHGYNKKEQNTIEKTLSVMGLFSHCSSRYCLTSTTKTKGSKINYVEKRMEGIWSVCVCVHVVDLKRKRRYDSSVDEHGNDHHSTLPVDVGGDLVVVREQVHGSDIIVSLKLIGGRTATASGGRTPLNMDQRLRQIGRASCRERVL